MLATLAYDVFIRGLQFCVVSVGGVPVCAWNSLYRQDFVLDKYLKLLFVMLFQVYDLTLGRPLMPIFKIWAQHIA